MVIAPFMANFMFPVPEASLPASEICSERSAAGYTLWPSFTLKSGRKTTFRRPLTIGSALTASPTRVNQFDNQLGHAISRRSLAAEDEGSGRQLRIGVALQTFQQGENVQYLQVLALILMQPLDENIKHRVRISLNPQLFVNICRELRFVIPLDGSPLVAKVSIFKERLQPAQSLDVADPVRATRAVSSSASRGLLSTIQRRGVTPLVLLENFSGVSA